MEDTNHDGRTQIAYLRRAGRFLFALGFSGLGIMAIIYADFALQWQPVPETAPFRTFLAYANGLALIVCSIALFLPKTARIGAAGLVAMLFIWVFVLHVPRLMGHWSDVVIWLGVAEALALFGGAILLVGNGTKNGHGRATGYSMSLFSAGRLCIGLALPIFGLSHFVYAEFTANMVPAWIPAKLFWAYFTGCAHVAAGVAILSGLWAPLATRLLAAMFGSWVLILHTPRVASDPANRVEWTMLFIAIALTASASLLAANSSGKQLWRPLPNDA